MSIIFDTRKKRAITEQRDYKSTRLKLPILCLQMKQKMKASASVHKHSSFQQVVKTFSQRTEETSNCIDFICRYPQPQCISRKVKLKSLNNLIGHKPKLMIPKISISPQKFDSIDFDVYSQDGVESFEEYTRTHKF